MCSGINDPWRLWGVAVSRTAEPSYLQSLIIPELTHTDGIAPVSRLAVQAGWRREPSRSGRDDDFFL
jgi:hypothetical protein